MGETFSGDHGQELNVNRDWEDGYRSRWQHDKVVRSTHGVNCTGSCSWKIYVKNGLVTWETQQTDYPRTRPDLPDHEPRGCPRGASYSWYLYSANRVKYPMMRSAYLNYGVKQKRSSKTLLQRGYLLSMTHRRHKAINKLVVVAVLFAQAGRR